jgi:hypothetical protein
LRRAELSVTLLEFPRAIEQKIRRREENGRDGSKTIVLRADWRQELIVTGEIAATPLPLPPTSLPLVMGELILNPFGHRG